MIALWELNKTTREIAEELGVTKNSVCGALKRLRDKGVALERRPGGHILPKEKTQEIAKLKKVASLKKRAKAKAEAAPPKREPEQPFLPLFVIKPPEPKVPPKVGKLKFMDLRRTSCRYVVSGDRPENFLFCGDPKERGSYCAEHAALCYVPLSRHARRDDRPFNLTRRSIGT